MSVIFSPLGAELRFTVSWALTDPSVAFSKGPNIAAVAAPRSIARRVSLAFPRLPIIVTSLSCAHACGPNRKPVPQGSDTGDHSQLTHGPISKFARARRIIGNKLGRAVARPQAVLYSGQGTMGLNQEIQ